MLYELRHYTTPDTSSMGALSAWFGEHVVPEWTARGMRVVGCWTVAIGGQPRFTTMLAFDDANQRQAQFGDFRQSDAWRQIEDRLYTGKESLVTGIDTALLNPTAYSPDPFQFMNAASPGVFEERQPVCDMGQLRSPYRKPNGSIGYRCPAESPKVQADHSAG